MKDLISIIMPVYNVEKFISQTIKSILDQTYENWELLLVDDGSKDNSCEIINEFSKKDNRIKVFIQEINGGAAKARNIGIDKANGRYICFLDSDDLWDKNKLKKQLEFMKKNNYAFTFTSYQLMNEEGMLINKIVHVPAQINYKKALANHIISTITVMIDVKQIPNISMPDIKYGQDTATWLKILKDDKQAYGLDEVLSFYRQVSTSISSNPIRRVTRTWDIYRKSENFNYIKSAYLTILHFCYVLKKRKGV